MSLQLTENVHMQYKERFFLKSRVANIMPRHLRTLNMYSGRATRVKLGN